MSYLLDTCAFLSYTGLIASLPLGRLATKVLVSQESQISISPLTAVELQYLQAKGRVSFPQQSAADLISHTAETENWTIQSLDLKITARVSALLRVGIRDPFDLLIASTALSGGMTIITCDQRLAECSLLKTIW